MVDFLNGKKQIHFIGIGGSGMYPLAQILCETGYIITGSDNNETVTLEAVRKMGIKVYLGHAPENIEGADLIIYSSAIAQSNPELAAAREKNIETHDRAELLGLLTDRFEKAVCVVGTHGKTTTTSMITHIMLAAGEDISVFVGGKLKAIGGSARLGKSEIMVCESCEFNDNFLKLFPNITVVLNIDQDHMEYFKTMDNLRTSFSKFCGLTTDLLVVNGDDENTRIAVKNSSFSGKIITFGKSDKNDYFPRNIKKLSDFESSFELMQNGEFLTDIVISVPGAHNVVNAAAACAVGLQLGASVNALKEGLKSFFGAGRRFERIYDKNGIVVADDYAHHPAEIEATLKTAKGMSFKRIWAVHQPFTYSRTAALLDDFAKALSIADKVVLSEIMGGREVNTIGIKSSDLAEKINNSIVFQTFEEIADYVVDNAEDGDLIITMSCGDIDKAARMIANKLEKRVD